MSNHSERYKGIVHRLHSLRRRQKGLLLVEGVAAFVLGASLLVLIILSMEAIFRMAPPFRITLDVLTAVALTAGFSWLVLRPLLALLFRPGFPTDFDLAIQVGAKFHQIKDRLVDAMQVFQKHEKNNEAYSLELADHSLLKVDEEMKNLEFSEVANLNPVKRFIKVGLIQSAVLAVLLVAFFEPFLAASGRLLEPTRDFPTRYGISIRVAPGDVEIEKGESVETEATISGAAEITQARLFFKKKSAKDFKSIDLSVATADYVSHTFEHVTDHTFYFFEVDGQRSETHRIDVIERPYVRSLQVELAYPPYSKLGAQVLDENVGDIAALRGTKVNFFLETNKVVEEAKIIFNEGPSISLKAMGKEVRGTFVLARAGRYQFQLTDSKALTNKSPINYRMSVIDDQSPFVDVTFPGRDVDLSKDLLLPLSVEARDDFGISDLRLAYRILASNLRDSDLKYIKLPLEQPSAAEVIVSYTWDLSTEQLFPEDMVEYYVEAFDNDGVSGPKRSQSTVYRARFPSIYELYKDIAQGHDETFEELDEIYEESKSMKAAIDEIVREMKRNPELDWEEKQEVQDAMKSQSEMTEQLEELQQKLEEMIDRMEQNDLLSPETLAKYRELQSMMEEMLSPEMREALQKLQESMEQLDPQKMQEAMEKFASNQEDFMKSMERTINLLKKLQIEQQLDESIRKAQDLLRRQEELNKSAQASQSIQDREKYAREQQGIRKDSGDLETKLDELESKMSEFPQMPQEQISEAKERIGKNQLQSKMSSAANQFKSGQMSSAQNTGQQISQELQQMLDSLQSAQQQLSEDQKKKLMQAFKQTSSELLKLSKQQEELMESTQKSDRNTPGLNDMADKQQDMASGLTRITNQVYEMSQNTFFVTSEIGKSLGKSMQGMQDALQGFEGRNPRKAGKGQGQAMSGLNEAASELRKSMQNMAGASSGIGFQEMMQKLSGMSQRQQGINEQTAGVGEGRGMTLQDQAAMSRLAAEQSAVRKSLEQLLKEAGNRSEILGDLNKVKADMDRVVEELVKSNVDRSVINRQRQILSRLLDAQHSMHDRDYSRKRKAEAAKEYLATSPAALSIGKDRRDQLKNELLKAMKEGYARDYKELIQKYFAALSQEQQENGRN